MNTAGKPELSPSRSVHHSIPTKAIVTGGLGGIGRATAQAMLDAGMRVATLDLTEGELLHNGEKALSRVCDLRDSEAVRSAIGSAAADLDGIDILVNCAGINANDSAETADEKAWNEVMDIDLKASWLTFQSALPFLRLSKRASVVNVSSVHARMTSRQSFPYAAAKAAIEAMTRGIAIDFGLEGVRANCVAPGWTTTRLVESWLSRQADPTAAAAAVARLHPLGRMVSPAEVAQAILFLADERSSGITGITLTVDGGLSAQLPHIEEPSIRA
ncbi:SDR family oxidoreductase [Salinibacterium sp. G-O1]|uniref:SDR family NAD(P)-dependent oxidoreductase n=1 Tax=Salinibacterium sp. G-O1 TaxID=3046208 RepID=UPI0024B88E46|nr:SDR family oxidoreductase [Salinibacterium sp. G-O1]MDJ0336086.1 SDR family oxidoreductase [Salinibacterium sp. G-O1]